MDNRPLDGLRVLDFGWILAVPHATAWLGTLGADVIRVETEARLDLIRAQGLSRGADGLNGVNRAGAFNGINFSKRGVTLNLADPRGRDLALELARRSDIVTENFSAGVMERLGLGYEALRAVRPDIIVLSGSPLGQTGPERAATGWGPTTLAYTGLPWSTGYPGGPPSAFGGAYPDFMIGVQMAFSLMVALHERARSGQGQYIDLSMAETVAAMNPEPLLDYALNGREAPRAGNRSPRIAPQGAYPCTGEDRWIAISVESEQQWRALVEVMGQPAWSEEQRFDDLRGRLEHHDELDERLAAWTAEHDADALSARLQAAGVTAAPVRGVAALADEGLLRKRGFLVEIDNAEMGPRQLPGIPGRFSAMPQLDYRPTPMIGEHNHEVFCGLLGLPEEEFAELCAEGVIA